MSWLTHMFPMPSALIFDDEHDHDNDHGHEHVYDHDVDNLLIKYLTNGLTIESNFSQEIFIWDCALTKTKHKSEITFLPTLGYAKYLRSPLLSLLKLLQKVPRNRRQKFVDTRFSCKLGF